MISIITPTNKLMKYFDSTIDSVMAQTYNDFEWVILDNSVDGYVAPYLERYFKRNPQYQDRIDKIKVYREYAMGKPIGYYKNRCVELTSCGDDEYVLILDHDDLMATTTLQDIAMCDLKFGHGIDWITGDSVMAECNTRKNTITLVNATWVKEERQHGLVAETIKSVKCGKTIMEDVPVSRMTCIDYRYFIGCVESHPRAIRKHWLNTPMLRFYEESNVEEDAIHITLPPLLLEIGYIERPTVIYMLYTEGDGTYTNYSKRGMPTDKDSDIGKVIIDARNIMFEGFRQLYGIENCRRDLKVYREFPEIE